jgi:hypothetical protein
MQQVLTQVPNYTCLETTQRSVQEPGAKVFSLSDVVSLEVSDVGGQELRVRPGAERFENRELSSFASGGLLGSGAFAAYARTVFLSATTTIQYHGDEELGGNTAARFDFRVPVIWSGYNLRANNASGTAGMAGSFWFDGATLELLRMEVRGEDIPPQLGISQAVTVIDYARMRIGDSDVLLPQAASMLLILATGAAHKNDIQFSHCHEYQTASSIRFDLPDASAPAAGQPVRKVALPGGLAVSIELETAIDSETAHVGDLIRGHVAGDVLRKGGVVIIPKGAIVSGRIRGIERVRSTEPGFAVTLELAEVAWESTSAAFYAEFLPERADPGALARRAVIPGTGVLHFVGTQFHIGPGFQMHWRTIEPNQPLKKKRR